MREWALLLVLVILISGCAGVNEITIGDITLSVAELPKDVKLSDITVKEIDNPDLEMEDVEVRAYELGPDGMQFDEPVTIELEIERAEGNSTVLPVLILQSGDELRLMDASYEISEDKILATTNVTHFSTVYHGKPQRLGVEPDWSSKNIEGFFEASSPISKVTVELGESFTLPMEFKKVNEQIKFRTNKDHYYQLLPEDQLFDGSINQDGYDLWDKTKARLEPVKIDLPPKQIDFSLGEFKANPTFTCTKPGKTTVYYTGIIRFKYKGMVSIIDNENWEDMTYEIVKLSWEIDCIVTKKQSCKERSKWYIKHHVSQDLCIDDCSEYYYCDMEECKCKFKNITKCNPNIGRKMTEHDYCEDVCPDGMECNMEYCVCEPVAIEISCNENTYTDEASEWERIKCTPDCPDGTVCRTEDCICVEEDKVDDDVEILKPSDSVVDSDTASDSMARTIPSDAVISNDPSAAATGIPSDSAIASDPRAVAAGTPSATATCTPDPFDYGEINVLDKHGSGEIYDYPDAPEGGYLFFGWTVDKPGIGMNYKITGPDGEKTQWGQVDPDGKIELQHPVYSYGTYTASIVDFETFGSYCGDGDVIEITIG